MPTSRRRRSGGISRKIFRVGVVCADGRIVMNILITNGRVVDPASGLDRVADIAIADLQKCRELKPIDRDDADAQQEAATRLAALNK